MGKLNEQAKESYTSWNELGNCRFCRPIGQGGCDECTRTASRPPPPLAVEVHCFVDQRFGRLELGKLLKDHDDRHC